MLSSKEFEAIAHIIVSADGYCYLCAADLMDRLALLFPLYEYIATTVMNENYPDKHYSCITNE